MTPAARSLQVFGIYLLGLAALLVGIVGAYDVIMAVHALTPLYLPTVIARTLVFVAFVAFALLKLAPPQLVIFGVIDLLGALWTWRAMRVEPR